MAGWQFHLTCPYDGAPVEHVASGVVEPRETSRTGDDSTQTSSTTPVDIGGEAIPDTPSGRLDT